MSPSSELRVGDLMTREVYTLTPTQSLPLAEALMGLHHIRHIPVVDAGGSLVGLVSHRDLLAAKISALSPLTDDERSSIQLAIPVSRLMRTELRTIGPEGMAVNAARMMREHAVGCLPVVQSGKLVGILCEADLLSVVTDSLALTRPARPRTMDRVMTRVPVTIAPATTMAEARAAMSRYRVRHLPVVDNGHPVAIVHERDLSIAEAIFREADRTPASHVASLLGQAQPRCVRPDTPIRSVLRDMFSERLDVVLVVDRGELVGIFTSLDACRILSGAPKESATDSESSRG